MSIVDQVEKLISPLVEANKIELVDVQFATEHGEKILRVFLDKDGGFGLGDCEEMSRQIGEAIEKSDFLSYSYILEVSSPGLERVLKKEKDFLKFLGKKIKVSVYEPINGQRNFQGNIVSAKDGRVEIDDVTGKVVAIEITKIARAKLSPDIE
jgi:ribosome maturation factor RimP